MYQDPGNHIRKKNYKESLLAKLPQMNRILVFCLAFLAMKFAGFAFTQNGTTFSCDGSIADANNAYNVMTAGDTLVFPPGTFTWGGNNEGLYIGQPINVLGSGTGQTFFVVSTNNNTLNGIFYLGSACTIGNFTVIAQQANSYGAFAAVGNGWRVTNVNFDCATYNSGAFFTYINGVYGLIDHCTMNQGTAASEFIFGRGPTNAWQEPNGEGMSGSNNAVIIENCTFNGPPGYGGYLTDANANAHYVVRYCTVNGSQKVDAHGMESNTPNRSCRAIEIYGNTWNMPSMNGNAMELRGGTGMVFNNTLASGWLELNTYAAFENIYPIFNDTYQTPANYPIIDQIGMGEDVYVGGTAQGLNTPQGYVNSPGGSEPFYIWNNTNGGAPAAFGSGLIPSAAETLFQQQLAQLSSAESSATTLKLSSGATLVVSGTNVPYTMTAPLSSATDPAVSEEGRDYFQQGGYTGTAGFNGTDGIGVGTTAQMNAITPTMNRVGFWVTDQGSWNTTLPANTSGEFFIWTNPKNGNPGFWGDGKTPGNPYYVPYTYPDPRDVSINGGGTSTGTTTTGTTSSGGWTSNNGVWTFVPYSPTPTGLPPAPTGLRVTGS